MGRHHRMRNVKRTPNNFYFSDVDMDSNRHVTITISEFEAMRLKHYIGLNQKASAEKMGVSQPTFSRILENSHQKITQAIIEGKTIKIYGGNVSYKKSFIGYGCLNCDKEFEDESASKEKKVECPNCNSGKVYYLVREPL